MPMSPTDTRAIRQPMDRVVKLAAAAAMAPDTEQMGRALWALSLATVDAEALVKAVEETTRNAALLEQETQLQQRVGMEPEHL